MAREFIYQVRKGQATQDYPITPEEFYDNTEVCAWSDYFFDKDDLEGITV